VFPLASIFISTFISAMFGSLKQFELRVVGIVGHGKFLTGFLKSSRVLKDEFKTAECSQAKTYEG